MHQFQHHCHEHQQCRRRICPDNLRRTQEQSIEQPQKNANQINQQHGIRQIFPASLTDLHNLRNKRPGRTNRGKRAHPIQQLHLDLQSFGPYLRTTTANNFLRSALSFRFFSFASFTSSTSSASESHSPRGQAKPSRHFTAPQASSFQRRGRLSCSARYAGTKPSGGKACSANVVAKVFYLKNPFAAVAKYQRRATSFS